MKANEILTWICENIGAPCEYDWKTPNPLEIMDEWCEKHCSEASDEKCWKKYFQALKERRKEHE